MKTLFTILILVVAMSMSAQTLMFKAVQGEITKTEEWSGEFVEVTKSIIIVYDIDEEKIKLVNEGTTSFFITDQVAVEATDSEYDPIGILFECVDSNGATCLVKISWFEDKTIGFDAKHDYRWSFYYGDIWYAYHCDALK